MNFEARDRLTLFPARGTALVVSTDSTTTPNPSTRQLLGNLLVYCWDRAYVGLRGVAKPIDPEKLIGVLQALTWAGRLPEAAEHEEDPKLPIAQGQTALNGETISALEKTYFPHHMPLARPMTFHKILTDYCANPPGMRDFLRGLKTNGRELAER